MPMSSTTYFLQPTLKFVWDPSCRLKSLKPTCSPRVPSSKLVLSSVLMPAKGLTRRNSLLGPKNMFEMIKASAFRNPNNDEGVRVIEQEDFIDGSSDFRAGLSRNGLESTVNRLSKWLVSGLFAALILGRHDAETIWAVIGSIINAVLSVVIKKILNQERPFPTSRSDPGMPSSHAMSIFYIFTFAVWSIVEWLGVNGISLTVSGLILAFGSYLTWLRVSLRFHTISQVVVGGVLGSLFSIFWHSSWNSFVAEAFLSTLWVQILLVLVAAAFFIFFLYYVITNWLEDER